MAGKLEGTFAGEMGLGCSRPVTLDTHAAMATKVLVIRRKITARSNLGRAEKHYLLSSAPLLVVLGSERIVEFALVLEISKA